jgi:hypothetical protein
VGSEAITRKIKILNQSTTSQPSCRKTRSNLPFPFRPRVDGVPEITTRPPISDRYGRTCRVRPLTRGFRRSPLHLQRSCLRRRRSFQLPIRCKTDIRCLPSTTTRLGINITGPTHCLANPRPTLHPAVSNLEFTANNSSTLNSLACDVSNLSRTGWRVDGKLTDSPPDIRRYPTFSLRLHNICCV